MAVIVKRSKRYKEAAKSQITELLNVEPAVDLVKSFKPTKFDQSVELIFSLGIDAKQADQMIRGSLVACPTASARPNASSLSAPNIW